MSELSPEARALFNAARRAGMPPDDAQERARAGVELKVALGVVGATAAATWWSAAAAAKAIGLAALVATVTWGTLSLEEPIRPVAHPVAPAPRAVAPRAVAPRVVDAPPPVAPAPVVVAVAAPSPLAAEVRLVHAARTALHAGSPRAALAELDAYDARFPAGAIGGEAAAVGCARSARTAVRPRPAPSPTAGTPRTRAPRSRPARAAPAPAATPSSRASRRRATPRDVSRPARPSPATTTRAGGRSASPPATAPSPASAGELGTEISLSSTLLTPTRGERCDDPAPLVPGTTAVVDLTAASATVAPCGDEHFPLTAVRFLRARVPARHTLDAFAALPSPSAGCARGSASTSAATAPRASATAGAGRRGTATPRSPTPTSRPPTATSSSRWARRWRAPARPPCPVLLLGCGAVLNAVGEPRLTWTNRGAADQDVVLAVGSAPGHDAHFDLLVDLADPTPPSACDRAEALVDGAELRDVALVENTNYTDRDRRAPLGHLRRGARDAPRGNQRAPLPFPFTFFGETVRGYSATTNGYLQLWPEVSGMAEVLSARPSGRTFPTAASASRRADRDPRSPESARTGRATPRPASAYRGASRA